jgi:hypothetical protein
MLASTKQVRRVYRKLGYDTNESWTNNNHKEGFRTLAFRPAYFRTAGNELRQALAIRGYKNKVSVTESGYVRVMDCVYE